MLFQTCGRTTPQRYEIVEARERERLLAVPFRRESAAPLETGFRTSLLFSNQNRHPVEVHRDVGAAHGHRDAPRPSLGRGQNGRACPRALFFRLGNVAPLKNGRIAQSKSACSKCLARSISQSVGGSAAGSALPSFSASLGMAATPKERLAKFYGKHNPDKVDEVAARTSASLFFVFFLSSRSEENKESGVATPRPRLSVLSLSPQVLIKKYSGNYPKMVKVLEAKYHDYGFFLGWEEDANFKTFFKKEAVRYFGKAQFLYKKHMPYKLRGAFYNMYYNISTVLQPLTDPLWGFARPFLDPWLGPEPRSSRRSSSSSKSSTRAKTGSASKRPPAKAPPRKAPKSPPR